MCGGATIDDNASGKVLDDPNFSKSNGAVIQQYQFNDGTNQRWNLIPSKYGIDVPERMHVVDSQTLCPELRRFGD